MKLHSLKLTKIMTVAICGILCFAMGFAFTNIFTTKTITTTSLLANYDLDEMIERSDLIVQGNVQSISEPFWDSENKDIIRRTVTITVNETFKGGSENNATIELLLTGGQIGNCIQTTSPAIEFTSGDNLILFLKQYHDNQHYLVLNSTQGALFAEQSTRSISGTEYSTSENYNFRFHSITKEELRQAILSNEED